MTSLVTPVDPQKLGELLHEIHYESEKINFLVEGFSDGFRIGHQGERPPGYPQNHAKAEARPHVVYAKLNKELAAGRYAGPFTQPPFCDLVLNPLCLVPKTTDDGRDLPSIKLQDPASYRLISDLRKSRVNKTIPTELASVQYTKFDEVIQACIDLGPSTFLAKTDIASAFRNVLVHPQDWHLLGMRFHGAYFFDKCLPFGLATSCRIFEELARAIQALVRARLPQSPLHHYLDDFIGGGKTPAQANQVIQSVIGVCGLIGIPISSDKTYWASVIMRFLGLDIDLGHQTIRVPPHKVQSLRGKLTHIMTSRTVQVKSLQSFAGLLNFYAHAKPGGRAFIHRIYDAQEPQLPQYYHVSVTRELKQDLQIWLDLLDQSSLAMPFMEVVPTPAEDIDFSTDASGDPNLGWGAYFAGK